MSSKQEFDINKCDPGLYNEDLAPLEPKDRTWGSFEIFNVWANDVQSLFGYTLAASLFISYGLNGWAVMAAIILAAIVIMFLCNLAGKPSIKYGVPSPVLARVSMGVKGANLPAMTRGVVAMFWYGVQTYFASTAVTLLLSSLFTFDTETTYMGMTGVSWFSYIAVWLFQLAMFMRGIDWITKFLNWAGPFVYAVMIALMVMIWFKAGDQMLPAVSSIFQGTGDYEGGAIAAFFGVMGTMIAYFAAVVINFGDFSRFVKDEGALKKGNWWGLPGNVALFSFIALFVTAGTVVVFGEKLTNPAEIIERVDNIFLTIIAATCFFAATIGINMVANFIPSAYGLANLIPSKINFKMGGILTAVISFFIGALWVSLISQIGIAGFVNTLGAILAPVYGVMMVDYYILKKQNLNVQDLFSSEPDGEYYYENGWNKRAINSIVIAAIFAIGTVWVPALSALAGFGWVIGAGLGGVIYYFMMGGQSAEVKVSNEA
ncbi:NCS1 family nucleobase:cation symporter-1 [Vibrio sp. SCSIO 43137]|uniref:NCS1 family nucleobase:cation symporter-1 n=1 Tax=Vibrio sp. SCSIO 43137 TaxID=3021011 RepID=UPI0023083520|nr:NCS1 family nucleobase:cation symporter-1 [Vibrio sp. SCSIO 43137]WCE28893.1 NCS1 family nucleobase:cation symporter-1 [Vibrio sp. SCSIO 43137]